MTRAVLIAVIEVALATGDARAQDCDTECRIARARTLIERGDAKTARGELEIAYRNDPRPDLLFALGQVELNLGNCQVAIGYYEKFISSEPGDKEVSLAEQAIGACRMKLAQPPPPLPPPSPPVVVVQQQVVQRRHWDIENTGIVALGGLAIVGGAGLIYYAQTQANDRSGTLSDYDGRLSDARTTRLTGIGVASAGALAIGAAFLRWRLATHAELVAAPNAVAVRRTW